MELCENSVELCVTKKLHRKAQRIAFMNKLDIAGEVPLWNAVDPPWNYVLQKYYTESHRESTEGHREKFP